METRHLYLCFLILLPNHALGQNLEFYVDVQGSDSWDGTSEANVDGSDVGPWRTLNHAIEEVRRLRPSPPTSQSRVTIFMLPGVYFLPSAIEMDERDSFIEIKVARWQSLIPSFPWIAPGWRAWGAIQGKEGIKLCSAA